MLRWVAAMTRTSTSIGSLPPTRSKRRSWSTRSNFTCIVSGTSPISSRNSVPPWACSNRPIRSRSAPVNDAFFVAEQFAFQQVLVEGRTVDRHELPRPLLDGGLVNRPGDLFLAGAGFARDQYGRSRVRNLADEVEDLVHLRALAQHVKEGMAAVRPVRGGRSLRRGGPVRRVLVWPAASAAADRTA